METFSVASSYYTINMSTSTIISFVLFSLFVIPQGIIADSLLRKRSLQNNIFSGTGQKSVIQEKFTLPNCLITLDLGNATVSSNVAMASDLQTVLSSYLLEKFLSSFSLVQSVSLTVTPYSRQLIQTGGDSSLRHLTSASDSSTSYLVTGNVAFSSGSTVSMEQIGNVTTVALSDSASVLFFIQYHGITLGLRSAYGYAVQFSTTTDSPLIHPKTSISLTLALGIGVTGLAVVGMVVAFLIFSRKIFRRKGHKKSYKKQAKSINADIRSHRTKRVQFNHGADTVRTIASPTSTLNESKEDDADQTFWEHVNDLFDMEEKPSNGQNAECILADLNGFPSPTTLTHQGFLDFLFGKPSTGTGASSTPAEPIRVIGDEQMERPSSKDDSFHVEPSCVIGNHELFIFDTNVLSPVQPQPMPKKTPKPVSAIEGLTFAAHLQVEQQTYPKEDGKIINLGAFLLPQCGVTSCEDQLSTACTSTSKPPSHVQKKQVNVMDVSEEASLCSSDSSSLGLDMVDFIRTTMDKNDPVVPSKPSNNASLLPEDEEPFDCPSRGHAKYTIPTSETPKRYSQSEDDHAAWKKNRPRMSIDVMVDATRSPDQNRMKDSRNRRQISKTDNSLMGSENDDECVYSSEEDDGAVGYSKDNLSRKSPHVKSPNRYHVKEGTKPVNTSLLALYDEEDVGLMDSSYDRANSYSQRMKQSEWSLVAQHPKPYGQHTKKKGIYDDDEFLSCDDDQTSEGFLERRLPYSASPKRSKADGSFPRM